MPATMTPPRDFPQTGLPDMAADPVAGGIVLDRTPWPRLGLRGPGTPAWCEAAGLPFPERINTVAHGQGCRLARLGTFELLVLPDSRAAAIPGIPSGLTGVFDGYRDESWAWLRLEGPDWRDRLAGLTAADLRPGTVPPGSVVQTRLAGLDAVLLADGERAVDIFGDIASAHFLAALLDEA